MLRQQENLTFEVKLDSVIDELDAAIQTLDIGQSISGHGTRLISQSEKFIS